MNIMITAGGTSEPIDSVRHITNKSTGRLAVRIQEALVTYADTTGEPISVYYVLAKGALRPEDHISTRVYEVTDTQSVKAAIESILIHETIDVVFHVMAISDFAPAGTMPVSQLGEELFAYIEKMKASEETLTQDLLTAKMKAVFAKAQNGQGVQKISSKEPLLMHLDLTPKVIGGIKRISPDTRLVGFKLLNNVSEQDLIDASTKQAVSNGCDLVVANDLMKIRGDQHEAVFVKDGRVINRFDNKKAIADGLVQYIMKSKES